ncbi:ZPR1 zinc-finger domain-domain-containing protein [Kockovaella imperatae]|uniref:ZPR1 zinc-finger domain-domain-containing protein n=1 Tax=Kockovaella imperatae TaxID=4999 RepID=A0A1Y1UF47_9TREE|nr:ZPR1 zinc-finger domain-domain-containing protein [Kockovaella imperatae]ORX36680.1 ZPR1 zinc-finger domain-domain-containing protein [Kockovaella imperatae]
MSNEPRENLFPSVGDIASRTEALPEPEDDDVRLGEDAPARVEQEEGEEREMQEVESLCMRCHDQGVTRLLLTSIPYFKEIVISSFRCDHCGHRDTEIQSAGEIQPKGVNFAVHLLHRTDLDRQIVKSSFATVTIPEVQLTIPPGRGQLTTVEGLIRDTVRDLNMSQPVRRVMDPPTATKIDEMLATLRDYIGIEEGEEDDDGGVGRDDDEERKITQHADDKEAVEKPFKPFSMSLDDPSGNSFFQFVGAASDPQWNMRAYSRTLEQNVELGLVQRPENMSDEKEKASQPIIPDDHKLQSLQEVQQRLNPMLNKLGEGANGVVPDEIFSFPSTCSSCGHELETLMQQVNIPYFQNIIIMATNCFACGYRDNEVKSSGAVSDMGKKITLKVEDEEDLSRDMLKSDTAGLEIPEIDLVLQPGTLGGRFTTLEGLLNEIYNELSTKVFRTGDSTTSGIGQQGMSAVGSDERKFEDFLKGLKDCMSAAKPFTIILDDPMSNSYLQNLYAPDPDPNMITEEYTRTHEQNEELGLNDIVLEGYEQPEDVKGDE